MSENGENVDQCFTKPKMTSSNVFCSHQKFPLLSDVKSSQKSYLSKSKDFMIKCYAGKSESQPHEQCLSKSVWYHLYLRIKSYFLAINELKCQKFKEK